MGKLEGHPLLKGGRRETKYSHGLSSTELETLSSICEAFLPPLSLNHNQLEIPEKDEETRKAIQSFYEASGAQYPVPDEVAELVVKRGFAEGIFLVKLLLRILSTRIGTLLLCGLLCLSRQWPFVNKFSEIPTENREKVIQGWWKHWLFVPVRLPFVLLKFLCLYVFFSRVGEDSKNPSWKAIDYEVDDRDKSSSTAPDEKPLLKGMVETLHETEATIVKSLSKKGLDVTEDTRRNLYKIKCDVVIVGSGCGGGVAAAVLAKSGHKVVVVEKGNYFTKSDYSSLEGPSMNAMYESGGVLSTLDGKVMILAGSTVGGGSAINWSACIKTPDSVRQEWANDHQISWYSSPEYSAAMEKVSERIGVTEKCTEEGSGDKKGTDSTWLVDAVDCGAVIITGCKAEKFLFHNKSGRSRGKKCYGVLAKSMNEDITRKICIEAKVTISAGGSLLTPPLMIRSGLKNRNIGRNLHLHPVLMAWGYFPESDSELKGKIYEGGIITSVYKVGSGANVRAIVEAPILAPGSFAAVTPWESGVQMKERMVKYARTAHLFSMIKDRGSGEVREEGRINYALDKVDKDNMKVGLRQTLRILIAAGAVEVGTQQSDGLKFKCKGASEKEIEEFLDDVTAPEGPQSMSGNAESDVE
ncbi:OLC1v1019658C1 [Oldenlandia corymbosa var. corymbosa]|uniref:Long-chain-alcohol oxidase n=1 Tax=Oldenlandia corymbosa var. corymbosa TaxID=529605 RepID=A0AAV1EEP0_OLDCO|nr:OLC1v1019658C1 [Oldenlandia corymbosa var. corymbosa]